MANKRAKRHKSKLNKNDVNSHLSYKFGKTYNSELKINNANITDNLADLASIKKDIIKSLLVASLILISLVVIYWVSKV